MTKEEKYDKMKDLIEQYSKTLYTDYDDDEYRMFFYNMIERLMKIINTK